MNTFSTPGGVGDVSNPTDVFATCDAAITAAAAWRLLGLLFERPRPGWREEITTLAAEVDDATLRAAVEAASAATESEYLDVLGPGGAVSPREVGYRGREDPGGILADVSGFYAAFAYRPRAEDPPDHVAIAAGFVGFLCLKEAYALARDDAAAAQTCALARQRFIAEHLRFDATPVRDRIEMTAPLPHLVLAARALAERTGPAPAVVAIPDATEADPFGCEGCPGPSA